MRTRLSRDLLRAIAAAVIRHHNLALDPMLPKKALCFANAVLKRFRFIQTRHEDRELDHLSGRRMGFPTRGGTTGLVCFVFLCEHEII
jgi:hypothetical protein